MKILIVSGFLGAGKTTFIKELIKRTDAHPVIMENEYGDNNLDSLELQGASSQKDEVKILEFMEGCVCCTMKDSFVNSVLTIYSSLDPEYLIIEPTGVGKLSNILKNLEPVLGKVIFLLKPIVVLSPQNFRQNMSEWPLLYKDQIENAGIVVFSKCEHVLPEILNETAEEILKINPDAEIIKEHYSGMDGSWWDMLLKEQSACEIKAEEPEAKRALNSGESFSQVSLNMAGVHNPAQLVQFLEDCLRGEFGIMPRAKGTIWVGNEILRFDLADKKYVISGSDDEGCQCVFIGKQLNEKKIRMRLCEGRRSGMGIASGKQNQVRR